MKCSSKLLMSYVKFSQVLLLYNSLKGEKTQVVPSLPVIAPFKISLSGFAVISLSTGEIVGKALSNALFTRSTSAFTSLIYEINAQKVIPNRPKIYFLHFDKA